MINIYIKKEIMNYEDKLRLAKEALESGSYDEKTIKYIFPELAESEDERIRKWLIEVVEEVRKSNPTNVEHNGMCSEAIAFLEKQGEQKPTDKVKPRFKVGDWITNGIDTKKIIGIELKNEDYLFENGISDISLADNISHLWTIEDAKDGDVLVTLGCILIFEKFLPKDGGVSYCHYDFVSSTPQFDFTKDYNWYFGKEAKVYPATKEGSRICFSSWLCILDNGKTPWQETLFYALPEVSQSCTSFYKLAG